MRTRWFFPVLAIAAGAAAALSNGPSPVALFGGNTALAMSGGRAPGADHPERIVSKRIRILAPERYQQLRGEWEAYTKSHPTDPLGWTELAKASRYADVPCKEYIRLAQKAVELDPNYADGLATLGGNRWCVYCPGEPTDPGEAIKLLEKALALDPHSGEPHYTLWVMKLSRGDRAGAEEHLRALLNGGYIAESLVDLAHNFLVGLEPKAVLVTNGDNDTYPPLALQAARGFRADVAVVNVNLLNLDWYREHLRTGPWKVPVPEPAADVDGPASPSVLRDLVARLEREKRPLYFAVTVDLDSYTVPGVLSLEGVVLRALPGEEGERHIDGAALARNMEGAYRLDSAMSLGIDWTSNSAIRGLMPNYAIAYARLADARATGGDRDGARRAMERSMALCEFHNLNELGAGLAGTWFAWDPDSPEPHRWHERFTK